MTAKLKAIALALTAAAGFITAATTALEAGKKQEADFQTVVILAQQLAEAQKGNCK